MSLSGSIEVGAREFSYEFVGPAGTAETLAVALDQIVETEDGRFMIDEIIDSGATVTFRYNSDRVWRAKGEWFGKNTTIQFDPYKSPDIWTNRGERVAKTVYALAHELYHAQTNATATWFTAGSNVKIGKPVLGVPASEAYAVRFTNLIRAQRGESYIQTHYNHNGTQYRVVR